MSTAIAERLLTYVQGTSLALWVSESSSLLGYPTILVLHTLGLALVVGGSVAVGLRLLGVARAASSASLIPLFRPIFERSSLGSKARSLGAGDETAVAMKLIAGTSLVSWLLVMYFGRMLPYIGTAY